MTLTPSLLTSLTRLSKRDRKEVIREIGKVEWARCAEDLIYWLDASQHVRTETWPEGLPYVFTKDPHPIFECNKCGMTMTLFQRETHLDAVHNTRDISDMEYGVYFTLLPHIRPFTMFPYIEPIARYWQREQLYAMEKSRDMVATWMIVAFYTWDTLFHKGRQNIFQSEDAPKTRELVERAKSIYEQQPPFLQVIAPISYSIGASKSGVLQVPTLDSEILGFPQGPDQIRQYHPSGVFQDEACYQIAAADAFKAIKPSIQAGGRFTAISSAAPSWFMHICQDSLPEGAEY
jgi:hypothetical protein